MNESERTVIINSIQSSMRGLSRDGKRSAIDYLIALAVEENVCILPPCEEIQPKGQS